MANTETLEVVPRQWKVVQTVREKFPGLGAFDELAARVRPAQRWCHRAGLSARVVKLVVAGIGVGLKYTLTALQVTGRMFSAPITFEPKDHRRRRGAA